MSSNHIFARALRMAKQGAKSEMPPAPKTRRRSGQPKVDPLVFVSLGSENAGLPGSSRTKGPVLQGIQRLTAGQSLNVIFKLPGFDGWIRATTKVMWLDKSGASAGLQFADFPGESRRVVDNWLAMRAQNGNAGAGPSSSVAAMNILLPAAREFDLDSYQVALPVEAIEVIPGPRSFRPVLTQAAVQSSSGGNVPRVEANFEKGATTPQSQAPASLPAAVQPSAPAEGLKIHVRSAQPFSLALSALVGMFVVAGLIFWHSQGELSRPLSAQPAQPEVSVDADALPELPADAGQNSTGAPRNESIMAPVVPNAAPPATKTQSTAKPETLKKLVPSPAPNPLAKAVGHIEANRPVPAQQMARKTAPSVPILVANSRPATAIPAPSTPAAAPVAAPASSIFERPSPSESTVPPAPIEKPASPAAAPMVNAEKTTGSVEVISDPYPSIRAPADAGSRGSRAVTLTIGHPISNVEPVYPPDALSQRISGTVKLHVVRRLDGSVESASVTDGPAPLRDAALRAVQQWRYEPTLLGSTPVKADEDVAVVFRITTPSHPTN